MGRQDEPSSFRFLGDAQIRLALGIATVGRARTMTFRQLKGGTETLHPTFQCKGTIGLALDAIA